MTLVSIRHSLTLLIVGLLYSVPLLAQTPTTRPDVIYKLDNTTIQAIVSEVNDTEIVYRRASNPDGPVFRMRKRDVQSIRYANGETEQYNAATRPTQPERQPEPAPRQPEPTPRYEPQPRSQPRYEPQPRSQTERPRYERPVRAASSGGYAFERGGSIGTGGIMFPSEVTPFTVGIEFPVSDDFGVGGRVWYWSKQGTTDITVQAIANYHLARAFNAQNAKIDPYVGAAIGKTFASYKGGGSESGDISGALQLGIRYLINEKVGPYAQLNLGIINKDQTFVYGNSSAVFELGVAVKFGR